jgi:hypothetical protein
VAPAWSPWLAAAARFRSEECPWPATAFWPAAAICLAGCCFLAGSSYGGRVGLRDHKGFRVEKMLQKKKTNRDRILIFFK